MRGLIQGRQLLISTLIDYAAEFHGDTEIVTKTVEGPIHRYTYGESQSRAKSMAKALAGFGVKLGDRIGTLAWNTHRHFELYYATSGMGSICHTLNPRLFAEQLTYIVNHAEDKFLFLDSNLVPLVEQLAPTFESVEGYIVMTDEETMPETSLPNALCYETLIKENDDDLEWPSFEETTASSLCYTSGTTGNPKGVLYAHRSTVLHSWAACMPDVLGINSRDTILPIVPMFHANAWGIPYAAAMAGAKMVFPGPHLDGESVWKLMDQEKVSFTAGVPTVWLMLLTYMRETGTTLEHVKRVVSGGSAVPRAMIEEFEEKHDCRMIHAWGMTEMSPLGSVGTFKAGVGDLPAQERYDIQVKQGRGIYGVEIKIVDDDGKELPRDGVAFGNLLVRGPWICDSYFKGEGGDVLDADDWFDTGDVCNIDAQGYIQIVDRSKDVIKSGGEWISSIDLENAAVGHPEVAEACVIGVPHPRWDERPLLLIVRDPGSQIGKDEMLTYLEDKIVKWWMPDDVLVVEELPHTATGKLLKSQLREEYADHKLPTAGEAAE
ncbi:MAG: 3-(methylthio)propionyl-CoA ligase [Alphaproteobacteria bacterium]|jgi:fatty-acyl-CoA synthase|nr:long-chain fatty acid--CoA ligase [Rhodospirillaceae bacterium]MDP6403766.1 3-(methylthio)propionyl-CoA ligase [Alphaproteobacteria bacterium]MDP6624216.1 3-(methylthio)propionyl-CoA ligase [Alphaproteobacteria bacterium]|tara:strand:+ start:653 stop:2296 length:1644 start_codon:yes stop_codon:yes gene_type:complete